MSLSYLMPVVNLDNGCDGSVLVDFPNVKTARSVFFPIALPSQPDIPIQTHTT